VLAIFPLVPGFHEEPARIAEHLGLDDEQPLQLARLNVHQSLLSS
jgi:hypothetical protein